MQLKRELSKQTRCQNLFKTGRCDHIEILRCFLQKQVSDTATNKIGQESCILWNVLEYLIEEIPLKVSNYKYPIRACVILMRI